MNCVKSTYRYYPTDGANFGKIPANSTETTGTFTCSPECTRRWWATSIPETNLKLIKTDKICACIKKDYDWQLTPSIGRFDLLKIIKLYIAFQVDGYFYRSALSYSNIFFTNLIKVNDSITEVF